MALIQVKNLSFYYGGSFEYVFENMSFSVDTSWRLGLIGRNGRGKTTLLNLLCGKYPYQGTIDAPSGFCYYPYPVTEEMYAMQAMDIPEAVRPGCELWRVICELNGLSEDAALLERPFGTLSPGERTKLLLAVLFSGGEEFLLIDEPTNHLDAEARAAVRDYLAGKQGFLLVSHDRDLLDACTDHILVLNRKTVQVFAGNFSVWEENKRRADQFAEAENAKAERAIRQLKAAARRTAQWAEKSERSKIGFDPVREPDRCISTRSFIGAKTKKMQSRVRNTQQRIEREIEQKEGLLQDIERTQPLRMEPLIHHRQILVHLQDFTVRYPGGEPLFPPLSLDIRQGDRIALHGQNGCGKSTLMRAILHAVGYLREVPFETEGICEAASRLQVSCVPQETASLKGSLQDFCQQRALDRSRFCTVLRQLDLPREAFEQDISSLSEGQKKKFLLAASTLTPAHLFVWDEPLNYIDIFTRMQMEQLVLDFQPTLLLTEHDVRFREAVVTKTCVLS